MVDLQDKEQGPTPPAGAGLPWAPTAIVRPAGWLLATPGRTALLLAVFFALSIALRLNLVINNDIAWYLHSAAALLDGGRLYRDIFFEVNPPLILYLTLAPVALARWLGVFVVPVYYLYVFALCALSLALSWSVLARFDAVSLPKRRGLLFAMALVLVTLPAADFGQREHLMVLLTLPYLLLAAVRALTLGCPRSLAVLLGVAGAIGFCIKPHFLLMPIAIEVFLWVRHRRPLGVFRPEVFALVATGLLYAASLPLLTPDYLTTIVPLAGDLYISAYRNDLAYLLRHQQIWLLPAALLLFLSARHAAVFRTPEAVFLLATGCFFIIYLLQMKGWFYQLYPVSAFMFLTLAWSLAGALAAQGQAKLPSENARFAGAKRLLPLVLLLVLLLPPLLQPERRAYVLELLGDSVRQHAGSGPIYFFSSNTWTTFPLVTYTGVAMTSRFPALWTLPGLELRRRTLGPGPESEALADLEAIERFTRDAVIADLTAQPPTLILVDARPEKPWYSAPFDFIAFFSEDPRFAAFWAHYEQIDDLSGFHVYRRCALTCGPPSAG